MASKINEEIGCEKEIEKAAELISKATVLIVTAGAGMGVDSGLPDFRGPQGFWRAYPPLKEKGLVLEEMSTPHWFESDPTFAWGFFGHRYNLYSSAKPHAGFDILLQWCKKMPQGYFVFTSNVDGHFQKAGFPEDKIEECHGSINFMQSCDIDKYPEIWPTPEDAKYDVDMSNLRLTSSLPQGPPGKNDSLARPNVLMFGDYNWIEDRTEAQGKRFEDFLESLDDRNCRLVVLEIGAGEYVPTVRYKSQGLVDSFKNSALIRINPRDYKVPNADRDISLPMAGLKAIQLIEQRLNK